MHGYPEELRFKVSSNGQNPDFDALGIEVVMHYDPDLDFWAGTDDQKRFEGMMRIVDGQMTVEIHPIRSVL